MQETETTETKRTGWRWGVSRWLILGLIILGVFLAGKFPPARPHIQLPAEPLTDVLFSIVDGPMGEFRLTNTLVATILADIVLLIITFFFVQRAVRSGSLVPKGLAGAVEALIEMLYNLTESTAGKWAKTIFPFFAAITMLVLTMNWMELIPGVDSIGIFNEHHVEDYSDHHFDDICTKNTLFTVAGMDVVAVGPIKGNADGVADCATSVIPFVRAAATDLNFTIGLAIVSVVMIQVIGVRALGISYFEKFIYVKTLFSKPVFGVVDFAVGLFEIVSEFSKIISFSFRLFGNIFAGAVLLFVIGTLIPVFAQSLVLMLEFGVGLIQAIVFGMLTMVFMAQATHAHHGDEEH